MLGLLQPSKMGVFDCIIFALISKSFKEGGFLYVIIKFCLPNSLVALDIPKYNQCLDIISLKLGLALLYVVINISGVSVS